MTTPSVGERIEQERRRRGWPKARLCDEIQRWEYQHGNGDHLGLNPNYVREWETDLRSVSDYYAPKLSAVLDIPIEVFVDRRSRRGRARQTFPHEAQRLSQATREGNQDAAEPLLGSLATRDRLL
jgi:transcriptional regulator with XRE-family HTH domain